MEPLQAADYYTNLQTSGINYLGLNAGNQTRTNSWNAYRTFTPQYFINANDYEIPNNLSNNNPKMNGRWVIHNFDAYNPISKSQIDAGKQSLNPNADTQDTYHNLNVIGHAGPY